MNNIERYASFIVVSISCVAIVECTYLGITGLHSFRQSDAYGYLLGLLHLKDFQLFDLFAARPEINNQAVFDIPIYEYIASIISKSLDKDPLVSVRYLNFTLWLTTAHFGYKLSEKLMPGYSGFSYLVILGSSPLFLHYFAVPLPDNLAVTCSLIATYLIIVWGSLVSLFTSFVLVMIAAAIKSPIPFVFLIFCASTLAMRDRHHEGSPIPDEKTRDNIQMAMFFLFCVFGTIAIELYRKKLMSDYGPKSGHHWQWYFGEMNLRFMSSFWETIGARFNEWIPPYFGLIFIIVFIFSAIADWRKAASIAIPFLISLMSGWLIFSNVYLIHNYYQLPVALLAFVSFACILCISLDKYSRVITDRFNIRLAIIKDAIIGLLLLSFLYESITAESYTNKTRVDFWKAAEFALEKADSFLLVSNRSLIDPQFGGRLSTKFISLGIPEFEKNCQKYYSEFHYILIAGYRSKCIEDNKMQAKYYIQDSGMTVFARQP